MTAETEHATLSHMSTQQKVTAPLGYRLDKLADYDIQVVYKSGRQGLVADALSRRPGYVLCISLLATMSPHVYLHGGQLNQCNDI